MGKRLWDLAKSRFEIGTFLLAHRHKVDSAFGGFALAATPWRLTHRRSQGRSRIALKSSYTFYPKPETKTRISKPKGIKSLVDIIARIAAEYSVNAREHFSR